MLSKQASKQATNKLTADYTFWYAERQHPAVLVPSVAVFAVVVVVLVVIRDWVIVVLVVIRDWVIVVLVVIRDWVLSFVSSCQPADQCITFGLGPVSWRPTTVKWRHPVFTVKPSFQHRHSTNRVSWSVIIVGERAVTPHVVVRRRW